MITGPIQLGNLAVYIVEEPAGAGTEEFITLEEGLSAGEVRVSEKPDPQVSHLVIENLSAKPCFIPAGSLLRGGRQDRTTGVDFVVPAMSGQVPLPAFCVEQGRWQHGPTKFKVTTGGLPSKDLRMAVRFEADQGAVWTEVARAKEDLVREFGLGPSRGTSLNEELERPELKERLRKIREALKKELARRPGAIGLAWAIDGRLSTVDVYGDARLFKKLARRIIDEAALEAATSCGQKGPASTARSVQLRLARAGRAPTRQEHLGPDLDAITAEGRTSIQFTCSYRGVNLHEQTLCK